MTLTLLYTKLLHIFGPACTFYTFSSFYVLGFEPGPPACIIMGLWWLSYPVTRSYLSWPQSLCLSTITHQGLREGIVTRMDLERTALVEHPTTSRCHHGCSCQEKWNEQKTEWTADPEMRQFCGDSRDSPHLKTWVEGDVLSTVRPGDMKVKRTQYLALRPQSSDTCRDPAHWPHLVAVSLPVISQLRISSAWALDEAGGT